MRQGQGGEGHHPVVGSRLRLRDRRARAVSYAASPTLTRSLAAARERLARAVDLSPRALAYVSAVAFVAVAAAIPSLATLDATAIDLLTFVALASGAAGSSFFVVPTGRNHGFHIAIIFIVAGAILLPPGLVVLLPLAQHLPDIVQRRYPWYIQMFNVGNYTVDAFAAWAVAEAIGRAPLPENLDIALAGFAACIVYLVLNHVLLAVALQLARGHSFRESGLFSGDGFWIDLGLAGLGVALAAFYRSNPYLIPTIVAPLLLGQRSFTVLAQLRKSEARFRAIFESTAMGSHVTDLGGRVVATNRSLEELLGYAEEELAGTSQRELTHPDDRGREDELFTEMSTGVRESYQLEKRLLCRDGNEIWASVTSSLVRDADGNPEFAIGMIQDVTRRKQLEDQLRHAQKMEAVGRLAGGIAHDFNNLLMVVETYGSFAAERATDERLRADLDEIRKASQRAAALTRQLLAFSRRQVLRPQVLDLNKVVAETHAMLSRLIGEDVEVVAEPRAARAKVMADPDEITQVILNLAVNARDAMPTGGRLTVETAEVELDGADVEGSVPVAPGAYVALRVTDTGTGMDAETQSQIFEPFFTTKEDGKGTGLGLSTVYGIVTQSGGTVSVESELGSGTTFTVCLPRVEQPVGTADEPGGLLDDDEGRETILLVEDEDAVRGAVRRMLARRGYRVLEAFDAHEAIRIFKQHGEPIDLLVTDVVMPSMSGKDLVEQLFELQPELRVLFVSGYADEDGINAIVAREGVELLQKPFTEAALVDKVRTLLETGSPSIRHAAVA
jgi:PAS domain S-box-containing protein